MLNRMNALLNDPTVFISEYNLLMKPFVLLVLFFYGSNELYCQDTLYLTNNTNIIAKITDQDIFNITYKQNDSISKKNLLIAKNKVSLIAYANGVIEVVTVKKINPGMIKNYTMFLKGSDEAMKYYKHHGGEIGTALAAFAGGGVLGLIPAVACSATTPKLLNLGIPKDAPIQDKDYLLGYCYRAKKMKQKKVWTGYTIGVVSLLMFVFITQMK